MESAMHILTSFDEALNALRREVLMMASLTERSVANARKGLFERSDELCNSVIADDESIDQLEKQVDEDGVAILTRFQPVASDLRQIVSAMKVSNSLERVADQAVNIARKSRKLNQLPVLPEVPLMEGMFDGATSMLRDSLQAYVIGDVITASAIKARDKVLDQLNASIGTKLTEIMAQNPTRIADYLNLILISRHLERIGDHATNIAEDAVYSVAAEDIRHIKATP